MKPKIRKVVNSFKALMAGWTFAYFIYVVIALLQLLAPQYRFIFIWTSMLTLVSWILFVLPLVIFVPAQSKIFQWPTAVYIWAILGGLIYLLLTGWWAEGFWFFWWYPILMGLVSGGIYSRFYNSE
jgi:hypothetical protein